MMRVKSNQVKSGHMTDLIRGFRAKMLLDVHRRHPSAGPSTVIARDGK